MTPAGLKIRKTIGSIGAGLMPDRNSAGRSGAPVKITAGKRATHQIRAAARLVAGQALLWRGSNFAQRGPP
jgi:hypothetical protein